MSGYEVFITTKRGYRYILPTATSPDQAYEDAVNRFDNGDDGEEGGHEDVLNVECNAIPEIVETPSGAT